MAVWNKLRCIPTENSEIPLHSGGTKLSYRQTGSHCQYRWPNLVGTIRVEVLDANSTSIRFVTNMSRNRTFSPKCNSAGT